MITRTAIFEGRVKPGFEEQFFAAVETRLAPIWRRFPHALNVRWSRVTASDPDSPPIAMIQQIDYPSLAAVEEAIASPVRAEARAVTMELMKNFEGRFYHVMGDGHATGQEV